MIWNRLEALLEGSSSNSTIIIIDVITIIDVINIIKLRENFNLIHLLLSERICKESSTCKQHM